MPKIVIIDTVLSKLLQKTVQFFATGGTNQYTPYKHLRTALSAYFKVFSCIWQCIILRPKHRSNSNAPE